MAQKTAAVQQRPAVPNKPIPTKKAKPQKSMQTRIFWFLLYLLVGVLILNGVLLILRENVLLPESTYTGPASLMSFYTPVPTAKPALAPDPTPTPEPEPEIIVPLVPTMIYFETQKKQSVVHSVAYATDGSIGTVDSATDAAWFNQGSSPGDPGNAIISGHVRFKGKRGTFSILKEMEPGERVIVEFEDGSLRYFDVESRNEYVLTAFPSFVTDLDGETRLTLITCKGDWSDDLGTSLTRVVVVCKERTELRTSPTPPAATPGASPDSAQE